MELAGLLFAASFGPQGEVRWQRRLGAELGDRLGRRDAAQFADGVVVLAAEGLRELIAVAYGADGEPTWSLAVPATPGYQRIGPAAIGPGLAGAIWLIAVEANPGSAWRYRLLEVTLDGTLGAELVEPGLGTLDLETEIRFVGATSDRVLLLTRDLAELGRNDASRAGCGRFVALAELGVSRPRARGPDRRGGARRRRSGGGTRERF